MQTQWYLCEINKCPNNEKERLKKTDNLSVHYPDIFLDNTMAMFGVNTVEQNAEGAGSWFVWLPIIPRVGDTLQFASWQVQVSNVTLSTDWHSKTGVKEGLFVSATISIRDDVVPKLTDSSFSVETKGKPFSWENYARRGHDLQYYAWELKHEFFLSERKEKIEYYRWHTRIRPITGDIIKIEDKSWRVTLVELASANESLDGYLTLELAD
ncbi:MAG: hypothetical protein KME64_00415 [Scytonematopsis contorta HA4267-MV1]|jgi:hypothetical protein|nr:hypothetical protein [Scytonematopsis contorta HA4267-MV1]